MASLPSYTVRTNNAFRTALARADATRIVLGATIAINETITIPERHTIVTGAHGFVKQGAGALNFYGTLEAEHRQVFFGFSPGDIVGGFRCGIVRPVWWGAYASEAAPSSGDVGGDEVGINCAIQTGSSAHGHTIELDTGYYAVSGPILLAGYNALLSGAGAHRTEVWSVPNWTADWKTDPIYGADSHGALIWIGSQSRQTAASMNTSVRGVSLNCSYAATANATKRVSGISTYGWVEEHSIITNVTVSYFSGYGIGVGSSDGITAVVNGLHCDNLWLTQPVSATAIPLCAGLHTTNASFKNFTIDARVAQGAQYNGAPWPLTKIGVWAQGNHVLIESGHIESVMHAVMIRSSNNQINMVKVDGLDALWGYDTNYVPVGGGSAAMTYTDPYPDTRTAAIATNSNWYDWSTVVSIYGTPSFYTPSGIVSGFVENPHTRVVAENISGSTFKYLVRDPAMGVDLLCRNTNVISGYYGALTRYARSTPYSPGDNTYYFNVSGAYGNFSGLAAPKSSQSDYYQLLR